ncbi:MAG: hypothetical protein U5N53_03465 [Mycobacterium sp.]|nr:hypothetical protein [Mycobacterium sp.]
MHSRHQQPGDRIDDPQPPRRARQRPGNQAQQPVEPRRAAQLDGDIEVRRGDGEPIGHQLCGDRADPDVVECVSGRDELGDLRGGCEQQPLIVGGLDHHIGEGPERGGLPHADHHPDTRIGTEAGDAAAEGKSCAHTSIVPRSPNRRSG